MKSIYSLSPKTLTLIFVLIFLQASEAGTRYKDIVFPSSVVKRDIQFGSALATSGLTTPLYLDFYEPLNDTVKLRPLVILIHGGSLISGSRGELDRYCIDYAKRGYAAATIDYRLGIEEPKGVKTISEALLRGVQDTKAAVRFLRSKASEYGIDTSRIYLEGSSAGSMIAVHYAYWDQDEIPLDINQAKWGNLEGTSGNPGFSTEVKGIVNYCGAIVDTTWIKTGETPVANFHGLLDPVVPPDNGVSIDFGIRLFGGVAISRIATRLGIYNHSAFFPQTGHGGNEDSLFVFGPNFFYSLMTLSSQQNLSSAAISLKSLKIFRNDSYGFRTTGIDISGNRIILPNSQLQYSCDSRIGTIKPYGIFTAANHADSGYVYVKYGTQKDSCFITAYDLKYFVFRPKIAVTDSLRTLKLRIDTYDANQVKHNLSLDQFTLTSTDPSVGNIDLSGTFTGKKNGSTKIIASCSGYSDTCLVRVENASGIQTFDLLENLNGWTFTGDNLDSLTVSLATDQKSAGNASFKINYKFTYDPQKYYYMVYLNKDLSVFGIPDSIFLDAKSDGRKHRLTYRFSDDNAELFKATGKKYMDNSLIFDRIHAPMTGMLALGENSEFNYPLTLKRIEIQLAGDNITGQSNSGTIYIDNLRLRYQGNVTSVENQKISPDQFSLEQNYPNPFNPSTVIKFNLPENGKASLRIYDILAREVATLVDGELNKGSHTVTFNASGLSSGIYFYRLQTDRHSEIKKMLLVK